MPKKKRVQSLNLAFGVSDSPDEVVKTIAAAVRLVLKGGAIVKAVKVDYIDGVVAKPLPAAKVRRKAPVVRKEPASNAELPGVQHGTEGAV